MNCLLITLRYDHNIHNSQTKNYVDLLSLNYLVEFAKKEEEIKNNFQFEIKSFSRIEYEDFILDYIYNIKPEIIGFSCYLWSIDKILHITESISYILPNTKIILGGPEVSARSEYILNLHKYIYAIVRGEGEIAFSKLLLHFLKEKPRLSDIGGIDYIENNKVVISNKKTEVIEDLNTIPLIYSTFILDISDFENANVALETHRGCPFSCYYCSYSVNKSIRNFALDRVKKELIFLLNKKTKIIYLMDPTFNINLTRAKEILTIIKENNISSKIHVELKAEFLDEELAFLLKLSNVCQIEIGLQSIDECTNKQMNRKFHKEKFEKGIAMLRKHQIPYEIHLISSLPGDDITSFKRSIDFALSLCPIRLVIFPLQVLPGTYFQIHSEKLGITYLKHPPYTAISNNTFSYDDSLKLNGISKTISYFYNNQLLRGTLIVLQKYFNINPSMIFEEWENYIKKSHIFNIYIAYYTKSINDDTNDINYKIILNAFQIFLNDKLSNVIDIKIIEKLIKYDKMRFLRKNGKNISPNTLRNLKFEIDKKIARRQININK